MAYDAPLVDRIRRHLEEREGLTEKKMFGGLCFLLHGNMCCGVHEDTLFLRLDREKAAQAVEEPLVEFCDFTGRVMKTMVQIPPEALAQDDDLARWVDRSVEVASALPPK